MQLLNAFAPLSNLNLSQFSCDPRSLELVMQERRQTDYASFLALGYREERAGILGNLGKDHRVLVMSKFSQHDRLVEGRRCRVCERCRWCKQEALDQQ